MSLTDSNTGSILARMKEAGVVPSKITRIIERLRDELRELYPGAVTPEEAAELV
jgi:hypothetical protein